jgi:CRP-like cAMP-binding protein
MFHWWSKFALTKLSYFFTERSFARNQFVYHEGDTSDEVFLTVAGEFKFFKTVQTGSPTNSPRVATTSRAHLRKILKEVSLIGPNEMFGDLELHDGDPRWLSC